VLPWNSWKKKPRQVRAGVREVRLGKVEQSIFFENLLPFKNFRTSPKNIFQQ
jgi:hypothetical protein